VTAGKHIADHCNAHPGSLRYLNMRQATQSTASPHNPAQPAVSSRPAQAASSAQAPAQHASNMQPSQPLSSTQPYNTALHQPRLGSSAGRGRRGKYGNRWRSSSDLHTIAAQQTSVNSLAGPSRLKLESAPDPASAAQAEGLASQFPANSEPASAPGRTAASQTVGSQPPKLLDQATADDDMIASLSRPGMWGSWPILNARGMDGLYAELQARAHASSSANNPDGPLSSADRVGASVSAHASAGPSVKKDGQPSKAAKLEGAGRSADSSQRQRAPAGATGSGSLTVAEELAAAATNDVTMGAAPGEISSNAASMSAQVSFILRVLHT